VGGMEQVTRREKGISALASFRCTGETEGPKAMLAGAEK
jgi:hypothetical protein